MSILDTHISIPKNTASEDDLDFFFLKKMGLEYIQELGGSIWTDFNSHDPGVTMLEMLCYAITDLGNRIDLPIEDLLASDDKLKDIGTQFYNASEILPTSPVTALDYRKFFIDLDEVKNCWLVKHKKTVHVNCKDDIISYNPEEFVGIPESQLKQFELKGLYDVYVDFEDSEPTAIESAKETIRSLYHTNRNLCEDLIDIKPIELFPVKICADIELEKAADEEMVHALILRAIENYFSPKVNFYSLKQMLAKGYSSLEIFDGPSLEHGFIDDAELVNANLRSEVRLSDIVKLVMNIPGVVLIKDISLGNCADDNVDNNDWILCLEEYQKPFLCDKSVLNYNKGPLPLSINKAQVALYLNELEAHDDEAILEASQDKELEIPRGTYLETNSYTTIQNDFPETYGIGQVGLPSRASVARKAQQKQLKGYLLFFDQILGSYFTHLGKVNELLSVNGDLEQTFFTQAIKDLEGLEDIVNDYPTSDDARLTANLYGDLDNKVQRKNKILDHLLARFAERFVEYAFILKSVYGTATNEMVLLSKENFLKDYKEIGLNRGKSFNYFDQLPENLWDTSNVSGVQKRISRLLGIKDYNRRHLSNSFVDIFEFTNADSEQVYGWRIRNSSNDVILSSTQEFYDIYVANRQMYFAVLQIIQTKEFRVEDAFENGISPPLIIDGFEIVESVPGKFSYHILHPTIQDTADPNRILASHLTEYDTEEEVKQSLLDLIRFMKEEFTEEGMFIVEHILLRPDVNEVSVNPDTFLPICTDNCTNCQPLDPYSYRVSIVLPGYTFRFSNIDFRTYVEKIIKEELPAHVLPKICWVGYRENEIQDPAENDLVNFENAFKNYLFEKTQMVQEQPEDQLLDLIEALSGLSNVYPMGRLFDCADENEELGGKVILGRINLGSI